VADGRRVKGNSLMPGAQRLEIVEVWVLPVQRNCKRCCGIHADAECGLGGTAQRDSYRGIVVKLKVPVTPMPDTDQPQIRAVEEPNSSGKGCSNYADPQRTGKAAACWPLVQDAARVLTAESFDFPPQGGGERGPEKDAEIDAEAVSKGTGTSLVRPCRNQKSQHAQSRGYKRCQARKMDFQVADRRDQGLMRCCGLTRVMLGNRNLQNNKPF
jgi:hypothetical protein